MLQLAKHKLHTSTLSTLLSYNVWTCLIVSINIFHSKLSTMGSYAVLANKFSRIYPQLAVNELLSCFFIFSKSQTMKIYWQATKETFLQYC